MGGFLVIVVHVVVPDRCLMALICMMVICNLQIQIHTAQTLRLAVSSTIRPNQSLAPTRTWVGVNMVSLCRGRHCQTQNLCLLLKHVADCHSAQVPVYLDMAPQD